MKTFVAYYNVKNGSINAVGTVNQAEFTDNSRSGAFYMEAKPTGFSMYNYMVDITRSDLDTDLPLYIIDKTTGYAYGHDGEHDSEGDISAEVHAFVIYYRAMNGYIHSVENITMPSFTDESSEGVFYMEEKPESFSMLNFKVDITRVDQTYGLPLYVIDTTTGYAYGHDGQHDSEGDVEATGSGGGEDPGNGIGDIGSSTVSNGSSGLIGQAASSSSVLSANELGVVLASGVYSHHAFENDSIELSARGNSNHYDMAMVFTRLSFKNANLLAATVESITCEDYTDQLYIVSPVVYTTKVGQLGPVLAFELLNTGSTAAVVTDVKIRLLYTGVLEVLDELPEIIPA